jgi:putative oxidoreductase
VKLGRLLARLVVGGLFIGHGTQKWFGWFGGPGLEQTSQTMEALQMRPGRRNAHAAAASEALGGVGIVLGAFTPAAAAALLGTMIVAIRTVHLEKGFWSANGGYEFNLTLIAALLAIVDGGPGALSFDGALGLDDTGAGWALAALAAGVAGASAASAAGRSGAAAEPQG